MDYLITTYDGRHLEHHGILGQKWGRRNGPPYPLDESDKSAAEKKKARGVSKYINDDGTITELSLKRKRYGKPGEVPSAAKARRLILDDVKANEKKHDYNIKVGKDLAKEISSSSLNPEARAHLLKGLDHYRRMCDDKNECLLETRNLTRTSALTLSGKTVGQEVLEKNDKMYKNAEKIGVLITSGAAVAATVMSGGVVANSLGASAISGASYSAIVLGKTAVNNSRVASAIQNTAFIDFNKGALIKEASSFATEIGLAEKSAGSSKESVDYIENIVAKARDRYK